MMILFLVWKYVNMVSNLGIGVSNLKLIITEKLTKRPENDIKSMMNSMSIRVG